MLNPIDHATTKAMLEYRKQQLYGTHRSISEGQEPVTGNESNVSGVSWTWNLRRSIGIRVMRLGARLAGVCMQVRTTAQS